MIRKINPYDLLTDIFDNLNTSMCSDCPEASSGGSIWDERSKECGCCTFCAQKKGHLGHEPTDPDFNTLQEYFDKKYGFFDNERKTCRLPREKRSSCCLRYTCESMQNVLIKKYGREARWFIRRIIDKIEKEREAEMIMRGGS